MTQLPWGFSHPIPDNIDELFDELRRGSEWLGCIEPTADASRDQITAMRERLNKIEEAIRQRLKQ